MPPAARETNAEGTRFTTTKNPTAVGDRGRIVSGSFDVVYQDRQLYDLPGFLTEIQAAVQASARFTDPAGNEYELVVEKPWQPPIPDWETGGGVVTNDFIHGNTGTESPLFPRVFSWSAFWGLGKVTVNGKVVNEDQWIHNFTVGDLSVKSETIRTGQAATVTFTQSGVFAFWRDVPGHRQAGMEGGLHIER